MASSVMDQGKQLLLEMSESLQQHDGVNAPYKMYKPYCLMSSVPRIISISTVTLARIT